MPDTTARSNSDEERELLVDMSERATLLYWNSDRSVNSIAEDLGLSKGRLYELIRPLASGSACPNCQSDLVFDNRTQRDRGDAVCPVCDGGAVPTLRAVRPAYPTVVDSGASIREGALVTDPEAGSIAAGEREPRPQDATGILAGVLIGGVAGILIGRFFWR